MLVKEQGKAAPAKRKGGFLSNLLGGTSSREEAESDIPAPVLAEEPMADALLYSMDDEGGAELDAFAEAQAPMELEAEPASFLRKERGAGAEALLGRQLANGLWDGTGKGPEPVRQARATALALLELLREGITSSHPLHGAQVKKAVEALLTIAASLTGEPQVAELALGVAWLVAAGPRTRGRIEQAAKPLAGLSGHLGNEVALRQHVDTLASR
ncbi:hypothetical protein ACLESD_42595 [Pyxidicoccus sp. 3LFB2]